MLSQVLDDIHSGRVHKNETGKASSPTNPALLELGTDSVTLDNVALLTPTGETLTKPIDFSVGVGEHTIITGCLLYTSPSPRDS